MYFTRDPKNSGGGRLNFTKFEIEHIEDCIAFLKRLVGGKGEGSHCGRKMCVMATSGPSYKFYEHLKKELDVEVIQEDKMECLIVGTSLSPLPISTVLQAMETHCSQDSTSLYKRYPLRYLLSRPPIR